MDVPVKYKDCNGATIVRLEAWPILDVHDTLSFLVGAQKLHVPASERIKYWRWAKSHNEPWAHSIDSELIYPIGLYGDSAKVTNKYGISINILAFFCNVVLWKPPSVRYSRYLVFAIEEERMTSGTLNAFLRRVAWSCTHAFHGRFPEKGPNGEDLVGPAAEKAGRPLTSGHDRFFVSEHRGDWQWHKTVWKFQRTHWNGKEMCHQCTAKGISDDWHELFWNIENPHHEEFTLVTFLAQRAPPRNI